MASRHTREHIEGLLAGLKESRDRLGSMDAERQQQVLDTRARNAAKDRFAEASEYDEQLVVFTTGGRRYGVAYESVAGAIVIRSMTTLPDVPTGFVGILAARGSYLTVLDLGLFFGVERTEGLVDATKAIVLSAERREIAVLAEEVVGMRGVRTEELQPIVGVREGDPVSRAGPDGIFVIDVARLFEDPRLQVEGPA